MKKINAIILLSSLTSASVFAGAYVENREAYNLASDQGEVMLRVGYNFDMGAGIMLTNTYNFQREDELKHGYNEIEGWYPLFKPTDKLTIQPGGLINDKSIGSGGAVYLDVNYKFVPWFNLTVRNRYNHNNYSSTDLSGELDNNDTYEIGTYWNFKITDKFSYTFEPHYFMRVNDFNSSNGKDHHWEITNTFRYRINEHWLPYFAELTLKRAKEPGMFRPKLLFTSLAALALGACSPQDPQAVTSAAIAKQVILPTYSRWVEADRALAASALAYCEGKEDLDKARADFLNAQKAWAELQPLLVGPLAEGNRAWQVQFWPDKKNLVGRQVEQLVNGDKPVDAASLGKSSVVVRGLSAYEYILFDSKPDIATAEQKARYCPLLVAIGEHQKVLAEEILKGWNSTDGMLSQMTKFPNQRYADSHEAIADLLRSQVTALDTLKKKLGAPMGRQSKGIAQPLQAEAWRSHNSLKSLEATLKAAETVWVGVDNQGLRGLLPSDQKALADKIDAAYATSLKLLADNQKTLGELLADDAGQQTLNQIYDSLNVVHRLHEGELAKALNIQLGFNANDGD